MEASGVVAIAVSTMIGLVGTLVMIIFRQMAGDIRRMADSVTELNTKVAIVFETQKQHEKRITRVEEKL